MVASYLVRAVEDPEDDEARAQMILAASYAGVGFGNAGVHLPHGMSYPVSGHVRWFRSAGISRRPRARPARHVGHPERPGGVPVHGAGQSRAAPPGGRSTRGRHRRASRSADAGPVLADRITWFMERLRVPNGLKAIGYSSSDIPALVEGTLPQHRVTKLSPRPAGPDELAGLFEDAMVAGSWRCLSFGAHMSVAGGLPRAVERAVVHRCDALQIFAKNANQWRGRPSRLRKLRSSVRGYRPPVSSRSCRTPAI